MDRGSIIRIPIFPLPGAILFPGLQLPLHIFEPRYRAMASDALMQPESRDAYARMLADGWTDAIDTLNPRGGVWTFWDYQAGAWQRDHGFRIDHLLLSPELADRMTAAGVDKAYRGREKSSDHTPVWVDLRD